MAINVKTTYPDNANAASLDYTTGSFRNDSTPSSEDGTPLEVAWMNDFLGGRDAILAEGGVTPSGVPDTAQESDVLDALLQIISDNSPEQATQIQTVWNSGISSEESLISPEKLDQKIKTLAIGTGQTYQDVSASRVIGVTYTNSTGRPIMVFVSLGVNSIGQTVSVSVNGSSILNCPVEGFAVPFSFVVPSGGTYSATAPSGFQSWVELR